jgi:hypothetical protein
MLYCNQCQLVHGEEHRFCQRCGQLLKSSQSSAGRPCTRCGSLTFPGQKFCTECGLPLRMARVSREEEESPARPPLFYPRNSDTVRRRRPRRPGRALIYLVLVLVVIGGVYVWRHLPARAPVTRVPTVSAPEDDLRREVEKVAEKIRASHLNKDINKWLSCYNSAYPNLGRLESGMLELWKNFDIKEVSYRISNVQRLSDTQISADIVWNIQLWDHRTHDYTLDRSAYRIVLEKSEGGWKIRDSKLEGGGPS